LHFIATQNAERYSDGDLPPFCIQTPFVRGEKQMTDKNNESKKNNILEDSIKSFARNGKRTSSHRAEIIIGSATLS